MTSPYMQFFAQYSIYRILVIFSLVEIDNCYYIKCSKWCFHDYFIDFDIGGIKLDYQNKI